MRLSSLITVIALSSLLAGCRTKDGTVDDDITEQDSGIETIVDVDGDGYADTEDCDDDDELIHPGAAEVCDGTDNNCDGEIDEGVSNTWYADADGDGFGDAGSSIEACEAPSGYVPIGNDCDDTDDESYPGAPEQCDGIDNDCDGMVDEDVYNVWYADADGDGFGDSDAVVKDCDPGPGYVIDDTDCDDARDDINPDAEEVCDEADNDCDGIIDENVTGTWYTDADGDGYGDDSTAMAGCDPGSGYSETGGDCDDSEALANPGQFEVCDELDNDCDGTADEGVTNTYYADDDGDGYGDAADTTQACTTPSGYSTDDTDCDDTDADINPGAAEVCDEADNDCDGTTDEGVTTTFYADADGDGYGDSADTAEGCTAPSGYTAAPDDCDDTDADINPGEAEECDYIDEDCDGSTDEDFKTGSTYTDEENCGYCGNDCTTATYDNASGYCDTTLSSPDCDFVCDTGYYDANGDDTDGCECLYISADDEPFDGVDADCDGEDGNHDDAIHVSEAGSASGTGAIDDPIDTISAGIDLAADGSYLYVLVAEGDYAESVTLSDGISLYGGFDTDFETRDIDEYPVSIEGDRGTPALSGVEITSETLVDGFTIEGESENDDGASAVGVWLEDCSDALTISNCTISASEGEDGDSGDDGDHGDDGDDGVDGTDGDYTDCKTAFYGGSGGASTCTNDTAGGDGGDGACPAWNSYQGDGSDGSGADAGTAGVGACDGEIDGGYDCNTCYINTACWNTGTDGTDAGAGADGSSGAGGGAGEVSGGMWTAEVGDAGTDGDDGSGGGGGGAGSGAEVYSCSTDSHAGGTGGGGGAGGCAGLAGEGGEGGGSSFGVLVYCTSTCSSLPVLSGNIISASDAGDGGDGGDGGLGGNGGDGGYGGSAARSTAWCGLDGGNGGLGGDAGDGGGGGGGSGGLSYAVYAVDVTPDSTWASADNTLDSGRSGTGGAGGAGGSSDNDGDDGDDGDSGEQNW